MGARFYSRRHSASSSSPADCCCASYFATALARLAWPSLLLLFTFCFSMQGKFPFFNIHFLWFDDDFDSLLSDCEHTMSSQYVYVRPAFVRCCAKFDSKLTVYITNFEKWFCVSFILLLTLFSAETRFSIFFSSSKV